MSEFRISIDKAMKEFIDLRKKWRCEMPLYVDGIGVGYQLIDGENRRAIFCFYEMKEGQVYTGVAISMDILKMCKQYKIPLIIGYDKKFYGVRSENLQWEGTYGMQTTYKGLVFQKVNLEAVKAEVIASMPTEAVVEGEK